MSSPSTKPPWSYFSLKVGPRINTFEWNETFEENKTLTKIPEQLVLAKNNIETCGPLFLWDFAKKITNPYELIYTYKKEIVPSSVSILHPLSRSYYKMIEILKLTDYFNKRESKLGLKTAHVCEGPGGFIEAIYDAAGRINTKVTSSYAMTLKSTEPHIPGWRRAQTFLNKNRQVRIEYGEDNTGNILKKENRRVFINNVRAAGPVNIFTADGGFDFTNNYIEQEATVFPLLVASIYTGLSVLGMNGLFVVKIFDYFEDATVQLLAFVSSLFNHWTIYKPATSRPCNSEQYFIGLGFRGVKTHDLNILEQLIEFGRFPKTLYSYKSSITSSDLSQKEEGEQRERVTGIDQSIIQIMKERDQLMTKQIDFLQKAQTFVKSWVKSGATETELHTLWTESHKHSLQFCQYFSIYYISNYKFNYRPALPDQKDYETHSLITESDRVDLRVGTAEEETSPPVVSQ